MAKVKTPLSWYGGKFRLANTLIEETMSTPHDTYVEGFGGAGHIIFAKPASKVDVYNDIHPGLINFFTVLQTQPDELQKSLLLTPYSRREFTNCLNWSSAATPLEKARQFYVTVRQSYGSLLKTWSYSTSIIRRGVWRLQYQNGPQTSKLIYRRLYLDLIRYTLKVLILQI